MDFKNQWDQDDVKEAKNESDQHAIDLEKEKIATDNTPSSPVESTDPSPEPVAIKPIESLAAQHTTGATAAAQDTAHKARRFLIAYMTTVFSALVILYGSGWLGYILIDHFLGPKNESDSWFYIDFAPFYISVMATLAVFGIIYIVASRYVAKSASNDTIGLKDWRAYKVVYAIFTALLIATGASIIAGLVYIPLAQLMIADDLDSKRILVQSLASLHFLLWIALLVWQERLVKKAKQSWLQGFVVVAGVALVVVATAVFPVGSKTDERFDHRIESDLSTLESKISLYKTKHKNELPPTLTALTFDEDETLKSRIKNYTYTVKTAEPTKTDTSSAQKAKVSAAVLNNSADDGEMTDEEYYDSLYETMYSSSSKNSQSQNKTYELCATFRTDTTEKIAKQNSVFDDALTGTSSTTSSYSFDSHKSGNVCFKQS